MATNKVLKPVTSIYVLINPITSDVFYVGATTRPVEKRLSEHIASSKFASSSGTKATMIRSILKDGLVPLIQEVEVCYGYLESLRGEKWWTYQYSFVLGYKIHNSNWGYCKTRRNIEKYIKKENRVYW